MTPQQPGWSRSDLYRMHGGRRQIRPQLLLVPAVHENVYVEREIGQRLYLSEETVKSHVRHLLAKLQIEAPGILGWLVRGCVEWQRIGLAEPDCVMAATDAYRSDSDTIGAWIAAGHNETEPFSFTDLDGKDCQATFEDVQPLFVENSIWFSGSQGCTSCHNADLTERSGGLDLSSYQAISLGTRRVAGSTSPGTDIFAEGNLEESLLYQVLTTQGLTPQGHSPDVEPGNPILYVGQPVATEGDVTATPTP